MARSKIITTHEARKERANTLCVPEIIRFEENQTVLIYEDGSKKIEKHAESKKRMNAGEIVDAIVTGVLEAIAITLVCTFTAVLGACIIHDAPESTAQVAGAVLFMLSSFGIAWHYLANLGNK